MATGIHDFEKNCFPKLKKNILASQFCSFFCLFLTSLVIYRPNMILFCQTKVSKGIAVTKSKFSKEYGMTLMASKRVFQKKVNFRCHI